MDRLHRQLWTFKLITTDPEDPPFEISDYKTVTIDLGPAPTDPTFLMLLDPLNRIVYYPSGIVPPGDDVRSYAGIVLGTYKTSGDDPSGSGFIYITSLLTNNISIWDSNPDSFVIAIDVGTGPIGITASDNPAHIAQTVLDEAIMVPRANPDDKPALSCDENRKDCRKRVRVERKKCRARCRLDPEPRPCLRDCIIKAREARRQCRREAAQICAESCTLSLKQIEGLYLDGIDGKEESLTAFSSKAFFNDGIDGKEESLTAFSSKAFFNIDTSKLFDKIIDALERKGQVEVNYPELFEFENSKIFVLKREIEDDNDRAKERELVGYNDRAKEREPVGYSDWARWYEEATYKRLSLTYVDDAGNERSIVGWGLPIYYESVDLSGEGGSAVEETMEIVVERIGYM